MIDVADQKIVAEIDAKYTKQSAYRMGRDSRCIRNLAQYAGKPFRTWNPETRFLDRKSGQGTRRPRSINLQQPMTQAYLQKMNSRDPVFTGLPGSGEQADVAAASLASAVLAFDMQTLNLTGTRREELGLEVIIYGDSFLKIYWDLDAGEWVDAEATTKEGDIRACVRSPLTMSIDPMATRMEEAAWVMEHVVRPIDWIENVWGKTVPTDGTDQNSIYQLRLMSFFSTTTNIDPSIAEQYAVVKEYWEAPSRKYPKGRVITTAGGQLLQYQEHNPYGRFPYVHFGCIPMPGKLWSKSPIEMTEDMQDALNKAAMQDEEWYDRAKPKIMAPKGSFDGNTEMNDRGFEIIEYLGQPPQFQAPPQLPGDHAQYKNSFVNFFHMVSGLSESTMGQQDSNVRSAQHYAYLVEQDHAKFGPLIRRYESSWEDAAKLILIVEQKFRTVKRQIRITGKSTSYKVQYFQKSDIAGNVDVRIVKDSILPTSPLLRLQMATTMADTGKYGQPGSKESNMTFFNQIGAGSAYVAPLDEDEMDKETARKENSQLESGEECKPPGEGENDFVHIYIHNLRRKEADFKDLPDATVLLFKAHIDMHIEKISPPAPVAPGADVAPPGAGLIPPQAMPTDGQPPVPASMPGAPTPGGPFGSGVMGKNNMDPQAVAALIQQMQSQGAQPQNPIEGVQ